MAEGARLKVALLARAGEARDHLHQAITDLGAALVIEADPNDLDPGALQQAGATTVLVSVEPAVEDALERLDDALHSPGMTVLFDEAETTSKLSGWDQARWARHLAAKLLGRDVLPPGAESSEHEEAAEHLRPGAPSTPAFLADEARMADFADEIEASALSVPSGERLPEPVVTPAAGNDGDAPISASSWASPPEPAADPGTLELDLGALEQAMAEASEAPVDAAVGFGEPVELDEAIDLSGLEMIDDADAASGADAPRARSGLSLLAAKEIDLGGFSVGDAEGLDVEELSLTEAELAAFGEGASAFSSRLGGSDEALAASEAESIEMDPELARLAASFDEQLDAVSFEPSSDEGIDLGEASTPRSVAEPPPIPDFDFDDEPPAPTTPEELKTPPDTSRFSLADDDAPLVEAPAPRTSFDFGAMGGFELAPLEDVPSEASPAPAMGSTPAPVESATGATGLSLDHLSLAPVGEGEAQAPADAVSTVLVLSGIGGPDAVRQLLRALPAAFPLAVLLKQDLDGGRHDRFVEQLAKISRLPVALAEGHETPPANAVRVLPEGLGGVGALVSPSDLGPAGLIEAVAAQQGAIVVLSGADMGIVEPVREAMGQGIRVLVQEPTSCFDGKAAEALKAAGATALSAGDLAARLDAYFPT